jgi:hypothetical protein
MASWTSVRRFRIQVEVCIEVNTVEQLDDLQSRAEEAVVEAIGERHIPDPEHGSISGSSARGLDSESEAALDASGMHDE